MTDEPHYAFGKNWTRFLEKALTPEREAEAVRSLREFLGMDDLRGKTFVDIGCGSGLFSLAAHTLGAQRIVSFDVDPFSVHCTRHLQERSGSPTGWTVMEGSVLDPAFLQTLGTFDVVYSWGVLHHTGRMREAIRNAMQLVRDGGFLYIAIYNTADAWGPHADGRAGTAAFWEWEKKFYNSLPDALQRCMDAAAMTAAFLLSALTLRNPFTMMRAHAARYRGMDWATDIRDWIGGYPYEHARAHEIFHLVKEGGFTLENLRAWNDLRNNEFLFRKGRVTGT